MVFDCLSATLVKSAGAVKCLSYFFPYDTDALPGCLFQGDYDMRVFNEAWFCEVLAQTINS